MTAPHRARGTCALTCIAHTCAHTHKLHILTCAYTPKGFHTHADVPSEAEHFTVCKEPCHESSHMITRGGETVLELAEDLVQRQQEM